MLCTVYLLYYVNKHQEKKNTTVVQAFLIEFHVSSRNMSFFKCAATFLIFGH